MTLPPLHDEVGDAAPQQVEEAENDGPEQLEWK